MDKRRATNDWPADRIVSGSRSRVGVDVLNYAADGMPPKMGHRVAEWVGKWGPCALYAPVDVSDETWSAALEYARQHSEMSF